MKAAILILAAAVLGGLVGRVIPHPGAGSAPGADQFESLRGRTPESTRAPARPLTEAQLARVIRLHETFESVDRLMPEERIAAFQASDDVERDLRALERVAR